MNGAVRLFAILDLFTQEHPIWTTEDVNERLGYSRPTGYRYIKSLVDAGLLQKTGAGRYALGARIVQLDYEMRQSDPVLVAGGRIMERLAHESGLIVVLSTMFGLSFVDIHVASRPQQEVPFAYTRGRPRSLFQGAAPKVFMSLLPRATLVRIYERFGDDIRSHGLGSTWTEFRKYLANIRREGFYLSLGELGPDIAGAAVAIRNRDGEPLAALALAGRTRDLERAGTPNLKRLLQDASERISLKLP